MRRRAAVLGSPIAHSLSPLLHRTAYEVLGLGEWTYDAYDVSEAELPGFLDALDGTWAGLSLTMPLKAAVLPALTTRTALVDVVGAANTVLLHEGARHGDNTDVPGLAAALTAAGVEARLHVALLGGGATARSALAALGGVASSVTAYARSPQRSADLVAVGQAVGVPVDVRPWAEAPDALAAELVLNTTPAGAADSLVGAVPAEPGILFDVVYVPWPTALAAAWSGSGGDVIGGLELLVHQAVLQVGLMTELPIDAADLVPRLRAAGVRALAG